MQTLAGKRAALIDLGQRGPIRSRDLAAARVPRSYLKRLVDDGVLERVDRGLYRLSGEPPTELTSLADVAKRIPLGTICLLSALQVHGMTTEAPHAVWVLLNRRARTPQFRHPALEVVRASGDALEFGVETREVEGVVVRVTTPAKTVADCFRYRRHVGMEVALAALREYLTTARRGRRSSSGRSAIDELFAAAKADRILFVMRPYIEALA